MYDTSHNHKRKLKPESHYTSKDSNKKPCIRVRNVAFYSLFPELDYDVEWQIGFVAISELRGAKKYLLWFCQ